MSRLAMCLMVVVLVLCTWAAIPARAGYIGITNGDFEAQSGKSFAVTDWNESSLTAEGYNDWLYKDAGGYLGANHTEAFAMSTDTGWIYQQIGTYSAGLQMTVSGDAIHPANSMPLRSFEVQLWTGGTASSAADLVSLTTVGATMVASHTFSAADLGIIDNGGAQSAHWTTPVLTTTGTVGDALWLRIAATATGSETFFDNITGSVVPEPSTLVLLATGLLGMMAYVWRKRR